MIFRKTSLEKTGGVLFEYLSDDVTAKPAMLVIPGGGYSVVCTEREGEPIALAYLALGYNAFVLHYSVGREASGERPLAQASEAVAYIRRNSKALSISEDMIFAVGFSAGGHLCGSLATVWKSENAVHAAGIKAGENRPDGVVLCYPVISGTEHPHKGSFVNLCGCENPTTRQLEYYSLERHVDKDSSPAFIIHTAEDELVPVENSLLMAQAYAKAGVTFELHVYPYGPHGLSLANDITSQGKSELIDSQYARWVNDSNIFLRSLKK